GADNRKALDNLRLQTLVPSLFSLASSADGSVCAERAAWPARYRLDALLPAPGRTLNLSHFLLGHGGDLAWLAWVVIDEALANPAAGAELPLELPWADVYADEGGPSYGEHHRFEGGSGPCEEVNLARAAQDVDAAIKFAFDPDGLFPHPGQLL